MKLALISAFLLSTLSFGGTASACGDIFSSCGGAVAWSVFSGASGSAVAVSLLGSSWCNGSNCVAASPIGNSFGGMPISVVGSCNDEACISAFTGSGSHWATLGMDYAECGNQWATMCFAAAPFGSADAQCLIVCASTGKAECSTVCLGGEDVQCKAHRCIAVSAGGNATGYIGLSACYVGQAQGTTLLCGSVLRE